jgi:hypothetical protein
MDAAKALNVWSDDGNTSTYKPLPVSARSTLELLSFEVQIVALMAADLSKGIAIAEVDKDRLFLAANRINNVAEELRYA